MTPTSVDAPKPKRLLFVCLGNICRSPAAHAVMEAMVADFDRFDYIIVMDEGNYRAISAKARTQAQADRILRMSDYLDADCGYDSVPDPYYGGDRDFELALDLIEQGCRHLLSQLQRQL